MQRKHHLFFNIPYPRVRKCSKTNAHIKHIKIVVSTCKYKGNMVEEKLIHKYKKERDLIMTINDDNRTVGDEKDELKSLHLSYKYK